MTILPPTNLSRPSCSRPCMPEGKGLLPIPSWRARWRAWRATQMRVVHPRMAAATRRGWTRAARSFIATATCWHPTTARLRKRAIGCFAFGMPEETIALGGQTVRIGRGAFRSPTPMNSPRELMGRPKLVARVRTTSLVPPSDAAPGSAATLHRDITWVTVMKRECRPTRSTGMCTRSPTSGSVLHGRSGSGDPACLGLDAVFRPKSRRG